jgi:membrane-associated HD superfamily phosphohydrolase
MTSTWRQRSLVWVWFKIKLTLKLWSMFLIFIVVVHVPDLFLVFCVVNFSWLSSFCVLCCLCLWIVHSWLPLRFSVLCFVCLRFVSCVQCSMCLEDKQNTTQKTEGTIKNGQSRDTWNIEHKTQSEDKQNTTCSWFLLWWSMFLIFS